MTQSEKDLIMKGITDTIQSLGKTQDWAVGVIKLGFLLEDIRKMEVKE